MSKSVRIAVGSAVIMAAIWCIAHPVAVGDALGRSATSTSEMINLRATWGGTLLGIGAAVVFIARARPIVGAVLGLLMWLMIGIGVARTVGFILDGQPDTMQWIWLGAEVVLAGVFGVLRRRATA